jgi:hypothetical protein
MIGFIVAGLIIGALARLIKPGKPRLKLKAVNAFEVMTCDTVDLKALDAFKKAWFDDPRSRPVE